MTIYCYTFYVLLDTLETWPVDEDISLNSVELNKQFDNGIITSLIEAKYPEKIIIRNAELLTKVSKMRQLGKNPIVGIKLDQDDNWLLAVRIDSDTPIDTNDDIDLIQDSESIRDPDGCPCESLKKSIVF